MSMLAQYAFFLLKIVTVALSILVVAAGLFTVSRKNKAHGKHTLRVKKLNDHYQSFAEILQAQVLSKAEQKKLAQRNKEANKKAAKQTNREKRVFVINFIGDLKASAVNTLREEITALLQIATPQDEVMVRIESGGGMVSSYGLAASQLQRLKNKQIPLTVCIDKIAASGGYLMACVANKILAAPFAIIGSIGVVTQLPNFHRFLKKKNIDFELLTAGEYKRTLTMFGENTEEGREKTQKDLEEIHRLFKTFIQTHRSLVDVSHVATGAFWLASDALPLKLVDALCSSDDYLSHQIEKKAAIYEISYQAKKSMVEKLHEKLQLTINQLRDGSSFNVYW